MGLLVLGLLAGLVGIGAREVHAFERRAANDIRARLGGEGAKVQVRAALGAEGLFGRLDSVRITARDFATEELPLFTEPERSTRGRVGSLRIELDEFRLRGLRVASLRAQIPDCRFDLALAQRKRQIRLSRSGVGMGDVAIREGDLAAFLPTKFREIRRATVRLGDGRVRVEGDGDFGFLKASFSVDAELVAVEGRRLALTNASLTLDGKPAEPDVAKALLDLLNPVIDLDADLGLYGAIDIVEIQLRDGWLRARGKTRIPVRPPARAAAPNGEVSRATTRVFLR